MMFQVHAPDWSRCMDKCSKYNRAMAPSFTDQAGAEELMAWSVETTVDPESGSFYPDVLSDAIWIPFMFNNGQWQNFYTNKEVDTAIGLSPRGISGLPNRNCAVLSTPFKGWTDWICQISEQIPFTCACEHPNSQMYLQLRGLCAKSNIDRFYIPRNKERSGAVILIGTQTTMIQYDKYEMSWKLAEYNKNTTAKTNAKLTTFALGSHDWLIENDHADCSLKGEPYVRKLKLTGCREGEFTCNDGQCIKYKLVYLISSDEYHLYCIVLWF